jgi:hypothetical protein
VAPNASIDELMMEIGRLNDEQTKALARAMYIGMNNAESREYDKRSNRLHELVIQLEALRERPATQY